jgi:probable rRNA maturation factor
MIRVKIASPQEVVPLEFARLRAAAQQVLTDEGVGEAKLSLAFVDNPTIHRLNKQFLDHDEPTDILTFPLSGEGARVLEGELVIGAEVAREVAAERGHDVQVELLYYVVHGILHLCGFDDTTPAEAARMRQRERYHLGRLGLPDVAEG